MGKHKTKIDRIKNTKTRHLTFYKRKKGLLKKAMELSAMCDVHVLLWIFNSNMKRWAEFTTLPFNNLVQIHDSIPSKDISQFLPSIEFDDKGICKTITPTELFSEEDKKMRSAELNTKFDQVYKKISSESMRNSKSNLLKTSDSLKKHNIDELVTRKENYSEDSYMWPNDDGLKDTSPKLLYESNNFKNNKEESKMYSLSHNSAGQHKSAWRYKKQSKLVNVWTKG